MMVFSELLCDDDFRKRLASWINKSDQNAGYMIPHRMPELYRYSGISKYSLEDICEKKLTVTAVREYNDMFDSEVSIYSSDEELQRLVDKDQEDLRAVGINSPALADSSKHFFQEEAELKRNLVDYLGAHMCCFSTTWKSILMWAHYGKENRGICIRYSTDDEDSLLKKWAFPVAYCAEPIKVPSLLYGEDETYTYKTELAVMISMLCKNSVWSYEKEWRLISPLFPDDDRRSRYSLHNIPKIEEIVLGYHFMRNCFGERREEGTKNLTKLLEYIVNERIPLYVVLPETGRFELVKKEIDSARTRGFIEKEFSDRHIDEKFYTVIQRSFLREICGLRV